MTTDIIPLVGQINTRSVPSTVFAKDQWFSGCYFKIASNTVTGKKTLYCIKRGGLVTVLTTGASSASTAFFVSPSTGDRITAFGATTSSIRLGSTNAGTLTQVARHISETIIGGITYWLISASNSASVSSTSGWYLPSDATANTAYTADGNNSTTITNVATSGMYPGQKLTAASNIVAGTRIVSINAGAGTVVLDTATTGGAFVTLAITKEPVAKIIDADFPTNIVGEFVELNGYVFIATQDGKIYNFELNGFPSMLATAFISNDLYTDGGTGLAKDGDKIIAFGSSSGEWFYNAGHATGSPLSKTGRSIAVGASTAYSGPFNSEISSNGQFVCWAVTTGHTKQVWMLNGGSPVQISTPFIETLIGSQGSITCISSFAHDGERFIFVSLTSNTVKYNLVYGVDTGIWTDLALHDRMIVGTQGGIAAGQTGKNVLFVESVLTSGVIYNFSLNIFADSAGTSTLTIQTSPINHGTDKRKFVKEIRLVGADNEASGAVTVSYSDNDYASFSTWGTFDMTVNDKRLTRGGSYKGGRAYKFVHTATTPFRAQALSITYEVATG